MCFIMTAYALHSELQGQPSSSLQLGLHLVARMFVLRRRFENAKSESEEELISGAYL